jgi:hypothetical protein
MRLMFTYRGGGVPTMVRGRRFRPHRFVFIHSLYEPPHTHTHTHTRKQYIFYSRYPTPHQPLSPASLRAWVPLFQQRVFFSPPVSPHSPHHLKSGKNASRPHCSTTAAIRCTIIRVFYQDTYICVYRYTRRYRNIRTVIRSVATGNGNNSGDITILIIIIFTCARNRTGMVAR